ncbi:hypothetical protein JTE90_003751 [Oedothorax gibbosus]|uniref:Uncharacterized protein n=1 Tax=Oedothorax gibbosus TaxID=931172 RepID=A0AAV6VA74_9ARAC|nr:hypothetical protein JTE90_003751 [Oedothorax gibbosus]
MCTILQLQPKEELSHIATQFSRVLCSKKVKNTVQPWDAVPHQEKFPVYRAKRDYLHRQKIVQKNSTVQRLDAIPHTENSPVYRAKKDNSKHPNCTFLVEIFLIHLFMG